MDNFALLLVLAMLIESIVTTITWFIENGFDWKRVTAIVIAIGLALLSGLDLFVISGLPLKLPYIGQVFTGLILSRGANALNDLFRSFQVVGKVASIFKEGNVLAKLVDVFKTN